jgi:TonB-linked outer membrane protein, SusC/RagA family
MILLELTKLYVKLNLSISMYKIYKPVSFLLLSLALCSPNVASAADEVVVASTSIAQQSKKITGSIEDALGAVTGAAVIIKGTSIGVTSDIDGNFSIDANPGDVLVVSFLGYLTQEITVGNQSNLSITLREDTQQLDEIVVTALGIKRSHKALGYAMTELKGDDLKTNTINPIAALQGKVAGVEISGADGGMFGSTKILLRGVSTLGKNNQPIYVVDGVIMDNAISNAGSPDWDASADDYGNELKNLNPDDFETVSVLKGAAATALYGSRGLNGAVVITTKSGKAGQGLGINVSQTFGVDYVFAQPDLQNQFGEGYISGHIAYGERDANGDFYKYDPNQFMYNSSGHRTLIGSGQGMSFGPRFDGKPIETYDHSIVPYSPVSNNYKDTYNLGFNTNTNVAIQGGNDKTTFYSSLSYKHVTGTLPNNTFERIAMMAKASHKVTDRVEIQAAISFANSLPKNPQPNIGEYFTGGTYSRSYDSDYFRRKYLGSHGGLASNDYGDTYGSVSGKGLWFKIYENEYSQKETSVRPSLELNIDLLDWLKFKTEGNVNYYYRRHERKELGEGYANDGGAYRLNLYTKEQTNFNAAFTMNKALGDWTVGGYLRGEYYNNYEQLSEARTEGGLIVPGQYFIENSKRAPIQSAKITGTKRMMSVAFMANASWKNQIFVDVTGRNDWSSSLVYTNGTGTHSYFYPSISGSWLLSETFELPDWISLGKIRASLAQVGNDTEAYRINQGLTLTTTQVGSDYVYGLQLPVSAYDPSIKPERKTAWEIGVDWRLFGSRFNIDAAYYKENTRDQIMTINVPSVSGVREQLINAGDIENSGIELAVSTVPFRNKDWEWTVDFTYTKNNNKIVSLHENVADFIKLEGDADYGNYRIGSVAQVGGSYGLLLTDSKPKIDEATGLEVLTWNDGTRNAYAQRSGTFETIGSMVPDFLGSVATGLTWKNLSMRVALDMRFGGYVASYGSRYGTAYGYTDASLKYRDAETGGTTWTSKYDGKTYSDGVIPDGIFADGSMATQPNGSKVNIGGMTYKEAVERGYIEPTHASIWHYRRNSWGQGVVNDDWVKELNYVALREISVSYKMPSSIASKIHAKSLNLGLTGRNLGYLYNTMPSNENPESVRGTSAAEFRARSFLGYTANFMFTINASF